MNAAPIRPAVTAADFEIFRTLASEYEESLDPDLRHSNFDAELAALDSSYGSPNAALLAFSDDTAAGCIGVQKLDAVTAVVKKLYVRPAFRRFGFGRKLLEAALDFAERDGCTRAVLDTERERLDAAYKLYRSAGFEECEPYGPVDYASPTFMELHLPRLRAHRPNI